MQFLVTMERPPLIRQNMLKHSPETSLKDTVLLYWARNCMKIT